MATINTLIQDIHRLLDEGSTSISDECIDRFSASLANVVRERLLKETRERKPAVSMSNFGSPCERKVWYHVNDNKERESLTPSTRLKFLFGDILEELLLFLAEASGHTVEGRQDKQNVHGLEGHRDAVIDGVVVDCKSASSFSFDKFRKGTLKEDDPFGYQDQLDLYLEGAKDDPLVKVKGEGFFFVVDKQHGHLCLMKHKKRDRKYKDLIERKTNVINSSHVPDRAFNPEPDGLSGNMKLPTVCSYCDFKHKCHPGLRTFLYSNGPRFLTRVAKLPNVVEVSQKE